MWDVTNVEEGRGIDPYDVVLPGGHGALQQGGARALPGQRKRPARTDSATQRGAGGARALGGPQVTKQQQRSRLLRLHRGAFCGWIRPPRLGWIRGT